MSKLPRVVAVVGATVATVAIVGSAAGQSAIAAPTATFGDAVSVSAMSSVGNPGVDVVPSGGHVSVAGSAQTTSAGDQDSMPGMEGTTMPSMDHGSMPGMDHGSSGSGEASSSGAATHEHAGAPAVTSERPRALVLGGFAAINAAALITAYILRMRGGSTPTRRPRVAATVVAR